MTRRENEKKPGPAKNSITVVNAVPSVTEESTARTTDQGFSVRSGSYTP